VSEEHVCVLGGTYGQKSDAILHMGLVEALSFIRDRRLRFCQSEVGPDVACRSCGFSALPSGHVDRCRVPVVIGADLRLAAWVGDALHVCDVRSALAAAGWTSQTSSVRSQVFLEGRGQAKYMRMIESGQSVGLSDRVLSARFEAGYVERYRTQYLLWLQRVLSVPDPYSVPAVEVLCSAGLVDELVVPVVSLSGSLPAFGVMGRARYFCPHVNCSIWNTPDFADRVRFGEHMAEHGTGYLPGAICLGGAPGDLSWLSCHDFGDLSVALSRYSHSRASEILVLMMSSGAALFSFVEVAQSVGVELS
jgi:hypothetical protein